MNKTNFTLEEIQKDCNELENKILNLYLERKKQKEICHGRDAMVNQYDDWINITM